MKKYGWLVAAGIAILATPALAQQPQVISTPAQSEQPADPADVGSIEAILHAVYDVISGPIGETRNWDRMRSLFHPGARLIPTGTGQDGRTRAFLLSVEDYIRTSGPYLEQQGFFEQELAREVDTYGNIAQVFSTYAARRTPDGEVFMRGINSIQLFNDGNRWWVMSIFWHTENDATPIPEQYLN